MKYVNVFESIGSPDRHYIGVTTDLDRRLAKNNAGKSTHTNKWRPWRLRVPISFDEESRALAFERYLKSGSGRAFIRRHFA